MQRLSCKTAADALIDRLFIEQLFDAAPGNDEFFADGIIGGLHGDNAHHRAQRGAAIELL